MPDNKLTKEARKVFSIIEKAKYNPVYRRYQVMLRLGNMEDKSIRVLHNLIYRRLIPNDMLTDRDFFWPYTEGDKINNVNFPHSDFSIFFVREELMSYSEDKDMFIANYRHLMKWLWIRNSWKFVNTGLGIGITCTLLTAILGAGLLLLESFLNCEECEKTNRLQREFIRIECLAGPVVECAASLFELRELNPPLKHPWVTPLVQPNENATDLTFID